MKTLKELLIELKSLKGTDNTKSVNKVLKQIEEHPECTSNIFKKIKDTITLEPGWLFLGADFNALEDRINTLLTKDTNKLKVYAGSKQFDLTINGITHRIREEDVVNYDGEELTGAQLYEKFSGSLP